MRAAISRRRIRAPPSSWRNSSTTCCRLSRCHPRRTEPRRRRPERDGPGNCGGTVCAGPRATVDLVVEDGLSRARRPATAARRAGRICLAMPGSSPASASGCAHRIRRRSRGMDRRPSSSATTARLRPRATPRSCSARSSGCTARASSPAPASAWRPCCAWSAATAAVSARGRGRPGRDFQLRSRRAGDRNMNPKQGHI